MAFFRDDKGKENIADSCNKVKYHVRHQAVSVKQHTEIIVQHKTCYGKQHNPFAGTNEAAAGVVQKSDCRHEADKTEKQNSKCAGDCHKMTFPLVFSIT